VPAGEARISVFDQGFTHGEAIFDVWRSYGGRLCEPIFMRHLKRMRQGARYIELDPGASVDEVERATRRLLELNGSELPAVGDFRFWAAITAGVPAPHGDAEPTVVVTVTGIPFSAFFETDLYSTGAHLTTSLLYRSPWGAVDPRIKTTSRVAAMRAERKRFRSAPGTWTVVCDDHGFITEAAGASLALIDGGVVHRAQRHSVLGGVSLATFCDLARELGHDVLERPLTAFDFLNADEVWLMTSSIAAVPVATLDGLALGRRTRVGEQILDAWVQLVGFDFRRQALERAGLAPR
jgi:branched-subunit amino acid aminotransferase/4-amino-4-deoxychorismate lyase